MSRSDALDFQDVSVVRGGRLIWSEGTFTVPAGSITAVIGTNGSGKTTLIKATLGLLPLASGRIEVFGVSAGCGNDRIGYVPQDYTTTNAQALRACDAVAMGLTGGRWGFGRDKRTAKAVAEALESVDAAGFATERLSALSGGQRQRVAIAQALVARPRLLALDEPLANLDLRNQQEIVQLLGRLNSDLGVTILVVAHDLNPLLPQLSGAIYLLDSHPHYASVHDVVNDALLTHLYGTPIEVVHTVQGDIFMRGAPS